MLFEAVEALSVKCIREGVADRFTMPGISFQMLSKFPDSGHASREPAFVISDFPFYKCAFSFLKRGVLQSDPLKR